MKFSKKTKTDFQSLLTEVQQELEDILLELEQETEIDHKLLKKIVEHHLGRTQESLTVLCKIFDDYEAGTLDDKTVLSLALWT